MSVAIDNDIYVYINGQFVGSQIHDGCAQYGSAIFSVPNSFLHEGSNTIAVLAVDRGAGTYADVQLEGDYAVQAGDASWGQVKAIYR